MAGAEKIGNFGLLNTAQVTGDLTKEVFPFARHSATNIGER